MNAREDGSLSGKRVVIAEDEGVTQLQLQRILKGEGAEVVGIASNGREAVELTLDRHPDFVLMDIRMPVMDGLAASREIMSAHPVCIVMLTAFSENEFKTEADQVGVSGYILKPVTAATLVPQLVRAILEFSSQ